MCPAGHIAKFRVGSRVRQTPEEGWRTYRPKGCGNNNKDEDNTPKTLHDKNFRVVSDHVEVNFFIVQILDMTEINVKC